MNSASSQPATCPECGVELHPGRDGCYICEVAVVAREMADPPPGKLATQFGLAMLMICVTIIAVCLAVMKLSLPLGIFMLVLLPPAYVRSAVWAGCERRCGLSPRLPQKLATYLESVGVATIASFSGVFAFMVTWAVGEVTISIAEKLFSSRGSFLMILEDMILPILSAISAFCLFGLIFVSSWPREIEPAGETRVESQPQ